MHDEYLDLVDQDDNVIGKKLRSEVYAEGLSNFRVVNAFLKNAKGEIWIPRRTANKRIMPLCLDMSVGGHVESGETYDQSFCRETKEELNLDLNTIPHRLLGTVTPHQHGTSAFSHVYEIDYNQTPNFNPNDFIESFWLTPQVLLKRLAAGDKGKDDLAKLVRIFYSRA